MAQNTAQSDRRWRATDDDILDAFQRSVARKGPGKFTIADVANEAGLTRVQIYNRFGSKDQLIWAYFGREAERFNRTMERKLKGFDSISEKMVFYILAAVKAALRNGHIGPLIGPASADQQGQVGEAQKAALEVNAQFWVPLLDEGIRTGEVKTDLAPDEIAFWFSITEFSMVNAVQNFGMSLKDCERLVREAVVKAFEPDKK